MNFPQRSHLFARPAPINQLLIYFSPAINIGSPGRHAISLLRHVRN
jgi:hypothetical protein